MCAAGADSAAAPRRWFPFAEGPRNCVGQSLAQVTLPATLAILLSRFTFRLADEVAPRCADSAQSGTYKHLHLHTVTCSLHQAFPLHRLLFRPSCVCIHPAQRGTFKHIFTEICRFASSLPLASSALQPSCVCVLCGVLLITCS